VSAVELITGVEYRQILDFPFYRVGDDASVWSRHRNKWGDSGRWRRLKPWVMSAGYWMVELNRDGKRSGRLVHRLVLEAFVGPCPDGMEACHRDGDRLNCALSNLRWDTPAANQADRVLHGTSNRGSRQWQAKLNEGDIPVIRELLRQGMFQREVATIFGVSDDAIGSIARGETWAWLS
jgi:hypothetical protein